MTLTQSIRGFPKEPLYSHLLHLSKETQHTIIHDPKSGVEVTYEEFLLDILAFQDLLRQKLPDECFKQDADNECAAYIAILCPISYEFTVALYAVNSLGCAAVPLSIRLLPEEIAQLLCKCDAVCLLTEAGQDALASDVHAQEDIILGRKTLHVPVSVQPEKRRKVVGQGGAFIEKAVTFPPSRPGLVIFTSGTTGAPKGVVHTREFFYPRPIRGAKLGGCALYHRPTHIVSGIMNLLDLITTGTCVELFRAGDNSASIWQRLALGGITILFGSPVMWTLLMNYYEEKLRRLPSDQLKPYLAGVQGLQVAWVSAGLATTRIKLFWREILKGQLQIKYGSTELGREVLFLEVDKTSDPCTPVIGKPVPGVDVRLAEGDHGELLVKAPYMFQGYLNDKAKTHTVFDEEGYYRTGDLAHVDKNGAYVLDGRASADFARFSGHVVPLLEVEAALVSLPYVSEGYILPVPDDMHGQCIGALVRLKSGGQSDMSQLTLAKLRSDLSLRMALYKQPTLLRVVVDEKIPTSGQGKLARNEAIDMYFASGSDSCKLQRSDLAKEMKRPGKKAWDWGGK